MVRMGGEQVLSYSRALALNHHMILPISVSCIPNPACGHTYSVKLEEFIIRDLNRKLNLDTVA